MAVEATMARAAVAVALAVIAAAAMLSTAQAKCANQCNGHGSCDTGALVKCSCYSGWEGADCSLRAFGV